MEWNVNFFYLISIIWLISKAGLSKCVPEIMYLYLTQNIWGQIWIFRLMFFEDFDNNYSCFWLTKVIMPMNHLIQWITRFNSRKFPLMKNENRKRKLTKCFSKMQSPTVLVRVVLSSDKNQGWRLGNWSVHPGTVKTGTNKGWNEVKWLETTESVPHRCQWRRRYLYVLLITLIFYSSIYFFPTSRVSLLPSHN